ACFGNGPPLPFDGVRVETVPHGPLATIAANAALPDPRLPLQVRLFLSSRMRGVVRRELERGPDVVHLTLARMGPYLGDAGSRHPERRRSRALPLPRSLGPAAGAAVLRQPRLLPQRGARALRRGAGAAPGPARGASRHAADRGRPPRGGGQAARAPRGRRAGGR